MFVEKRFDGGQGLGWIFHSQWESTTWARAIEAPIVDVRPPGLRKHIE